MFLMYKNCFPPLFEWTENQILFHSTTCTEDLNCGGKESYTKTLKPQSTVPFAPRGLDRRCRVLGKSMAPAPGVVIQQNPEMLIVETARFVT